MTARMTPSHLTPDPKSLGLCYNRLFGRWPSSKTTGVRADMLELLK